MAVLKSYSPVLSIYCDESHPIKNDGCSFYVIGCSVTDTKDFATIDQDIANLKKKYGYEKDYEIKWSRINGKNVELVKDLIKYVKNSNIGLRILIVPNKAVR